MGGRYYITGVQIGMLKAFVESGDPDDEQKIINVLDEIEEKQFIGDKSFFDRFFDKKED